MSDLSLDLNSGSATFGDLLLINGDFVFTSDVDPRGTNPVNQDIFTRLRTFEGEWFLDTTTGVPWFQLIFAKGTPQASIDNALQAAILETPGVTALLTYSFSLNRGARAATVNFLVDTTAGTISYADTLEFSGGAAL